MSPSSDPAGGRGTGPATASASRAESTDPVRALLLRGGRVAGPTGTAVRDVLVVGAQVVAVDADLPGVRLPGVPVTEVDLAGRLVLPALVDQHSHPTGGGGGGGPHTQNLPIRFEQYTTAGIGTVVGCLGHDTVVRTHEALLARVRALRAQGLTGYLFTGEIGHPPATLTGDVRRDLALFDEVRGVKAAVGEVGAVGTVDELRRLAGAVARGSRTGGKPPVLHLHLGPDRRGVDLVARAVADGLVPAAMVTVTHVNWNPDVLAAAIDLAHAGVGVDVTACIRPDYFPGAVPPHRAVAELLDRVPVEQVTVTSDAGGAHPHDGALVPHRPVLLLDVLRHCLADRVAPPHLLAAVFAGNAARRLGLTGVGTVTPGGRADLLVVDGSGREPITLLLGGRTVVEAGVPTVTDPVGDPPAPDPVEAPV
ncbi:hypothetical protein [Micromonospora cathayae]|uniref:Beta-aspartyl-dipeptidase (Metallo-type) n=1 Tax=Micromonospora cathayae TaxID=3028804 RepID=A0ABY7ZKG4_9ACTN|nr:hypothetical protein [Micromonospora sp. HUAS 3]WDZ83451.1 hypothetical protein PVK37_23735 [Micromonospora sp. HUAS 3]